MLTLFVKLQVDESTGGNSISSYFSSAASTPLQEVFQLPSTADNAVLGGFSASPVGGFTAASANFGASSSSAFDVFSSQQPQSDAIYDSSASVFQSPVTGEADATHQVQDAFQFVSNGPNFQQPTSVVDPQHFYQQQSTSQFPQEDYATNGSYPTTPSGSLNSGFIFKQVKHTLGILL